MKVFSSIINDFKTLTKFQIGIKYVVPFALIIFSWGAIGSLYMIAIKQTDLVVIKGYIYEISTEKHKNGNNLILKVNETNYRLLNHGYDLNKIITTINNDRNVELLIRTPFQYMLSLGKPNDIMQIKQNNTMLISFNQMKKNYKALFLFCGIISLLLISIIFVFKKR
jgi:hypothetical protein